MGYSAAQFKVTGLYVDGSYVHKILTGQRNASKVVQAIREILEFPEPVRDSARKGARQNVRHQKSDAKQGNRYRSIVCISPAAPQLCIK